MSECLFCKILAGDIPSQKVFENDNIYAFKDINPLAKEHFLFIHKKHSSNVLDMMQNDPEQIKDIMLAITEFCEKASFKSDGFRVVTNIGKHGGQTVFHTHFHLLAGEQLKGFGA
jgi:histidine triad (HIT) family protein